MFVCRLIVKKCVVSVSGRAGRMMRVTEAPPDGKAYLLSAWTGSDSTAVTTTVLVRAPRSAS